MLALCFLLATGGQVAAEQVELFDSDVERVIETFANTEEFQKEARVILDSVSGKVTELNPPLTHALIAKIPLAPPQELHVKADRIDEVITQMFVVMPKQGGRRPYLILHTKANDTLVLEFGEKTDRLRRLLHLGPSAG
nr:hypothetical protein [Brevibacillus sp. SYP-B805]